MGFLVKSGLVLSVLLLLAGCGGGGSSMGSSRTFGTLEFVLTIPKTTFAPGETVPMTFTVRNSGSRAVITKHIGCEPAFLVYHDGQALKGTPFCGIDEFFEVTFSPGETKTYHLNWDQRSGDQELQSPAGQYSITAWLDAIAVDENQLTFTQARQELASNPVVFTIGP